MKDYRHPKYKELYKLTGFFVILAATFTVAFKATSWLIWAQGYINTSI